MDKFQEKAVSRCLESEEKLTQWEFEFLNSIAGREKLTDKQAHVLNEILEKVDFI